ncbi:MAG: FkbM family methyltransferase [Phycisphaeraceae bacterium]
MSFTMKALGHTGASLLRLYGHIAPTGRGMYRLARGVVRLYGNELPRRYVTPWRVTLELDPQTYPDACMAFGVYELETMRLIRRVLRPGDHFVDGGANLGYFTSLAARCVGPTGRVDAFEPEPCNRARLIDHMRHNALLDIVRIHDTALGDASGTATLHRRDWINHGAASLFGGKAARPDEDEANATRVRIVRLDEAIDASPRLIKLDVEGAEVAALRGGMGLFDQEEPPWVLCECQPSHLKRAGTSPRELVDAIRSINSRYDVSVIGDRGAESRAVDVDALTRRGECNLLFRPRPRR